MKDTDKYIGHIHNCNAENIVIKKMNRKMKEKPFDIETIFDKTYKPGNELKMGKKEKKKTKEKLAFSFFTREEGKIAKSYKSNYPM